MRCTPVRYGAVMLLLTASACTTDSKPEFVPAQQPPIMEVPMPQYSEPRLLSPVPARKKRKNSRTVRPKQVDAFTVYPWMDGKVYEVAVTPGYFTTVYLEPGEKFPGEIAAGDNDKTHWAIDATMANIGGIPTVVLIVRAGEPGLKTNALIPTDRRVYQLELRSYAQRAMDAVKWTYSSSTTLQPLTPNKQVMVASLGGAVPAMGQRSGMMGAAIDPTMLNTNYLVERDSGRPRWTPTFVYDFGQSQTYIKFPGNLSSIGAPALFEVNGSSIGNPVPYSLQGNVYITHRPVYDAMLRLGEDAVRVTRGQ